MISRRSFLIGSSAALSLPMLSRITSFMDRHGSPLLRAPDYSDCELYVHPDRDFLITMGGDPDCLPMSYTWREYLLDLMHYPKPGNTKQWRELCQDNGITEDCLDDECPFDYWFDTWAENESPKADARKYLQSLDLGPWLSSDGTSDYGLDFTHSMYGFDCIGAYARNEVSVSLLQERLNELSENTEMIMAT